MLVSLRVALTIVALVAAMGVSAYFGRRQVSATTVLALISFAWLTLDSRFEGGILFTVSPSHGLTVADLYGLTGLAVSALQARAHWRRRR